MATIYEVHGSAYYANLSEAMETARHEANSNGIEVTVIRHVVKPTQSILLKALNGFGLDPEDLEASEVAAVVNPRKGKR